MRILNRYILFDYLTIFLVSGFVITFVMCLGAMFQAIDVLSKGGDLRTIGLLFWFSLPYILTFSIPMAALTACLLLFGRMSMDGEINALRSSGFSIWQISAPVLFCAILLSLLCLFLNYEISPRSYQNKHELLVNQNPATLLQAGDYNDLGAYQIKFDEREGDEIRKVAVNQLHENKLIRTILAEEGRIVTDMTNNLMTIDLFDCYMDEVTENSQSKVKHMSFPISLREFVSKARKKLKGRTFHELSEFITDPHSAYPEVDPGDPRGREILVHKKLEGMIEMNKRIALSMSCFAFVLLGIPLGMKTKRKESSMGFFISLPLVLGFYFFVILADALVKYPHLMPDTLIWIPLILAQVAGFILLCRIA